MENEILNASEELCEDICEESSEPSCECCEAESCDAEASTETKKEKMLRKCNEVKARCCGTAGRIIGDLKDCDYNPHFKQIRSYRLEVYRKADDEEPIDEFELSDVKSFSARSLAIACGLTVALTAVTGLIVNKLFD
ncbi:MAG: hypothetical protein E7643_01715 [Ruminococcaceae bacterium]|nr:hypothetical protein [Oscillospiraceae bacterium]